MYQYYLFDLDGTLTDPGIGLTNSIKILKHFNIYQYFDHIAAATMDETRTDKAEVISYALELCKPTDLSQVLMVGDRFHDINGAKANGIDSVGVLCGYGSREELVNSGATYIVDNTVDIFSL